MIRRFRLEMYELDFDRKKWERLPGHRLEFTVTLQDNSDAIWIAIEDHVAAVIKEKKAIYEGRKTRQ